MDQPDPPGARPMITVLHVMSRMAPSGTELQLAATLRAARRGYWEPTLCVLYPGFPLARQVAESGVEVVELGGSRLHADRLVALRRLIGRRRFDVVHTSLWGAGAFGRLGAAGRHRPAVVVSERRVEDFRGRGRRLADRALARVTDEWIGNSADVADFIVRAHGAPRERVHVIGNGIDTTVFHPGAAAIARAVPRIGTVGRLVHQKGFDVLLAALPAVLATRPVEVVIVGEGELRADLERAAAGLPVLLPGALPGGVAVAGFLRGLDLFVLPSRYEGLPNVVLEALACGVPVIATAAPGMREAVGGRARLVPPGDAPALAAGILAALADPPPPAAKVARGFDEVAAGHLEVFERALDRRRAGQLGVGVRRREGDGQCGS